MGEHALPEPEQPEDVGDADTTDPIQLHETDAEPVDPPADWDPEAHADAYASDPDVVVTDDDGDDDPDDSDDLAPGASEAA